MFESLRLPNGNLGRRSTLRSDSREPVALRCGGFLRVVPVGEDADGDDHDDDEDDDDGDDDDGCW